MSREWQLYLDDMVECCRKISSYTKDVDFSVFATRGILYDAVIRNLEVIGEAAKNIPETTREQHPQIRWRQVAALRNVLAHGYFGLEDETLWDIVRNEVPTLLAQLEAFPRSDTPSQQDAEGNRGDDQP